MTLIASLRIGDYPILIGDLLLSNKREPSEAVILPTLGELPKSHSSDATNYISGLSQKICIVNARLVVAWSGRQVYARDIIGEMKDYFSSRTIDHDSLTEFLRTQNENYLREVNFICWFSNDLGHNDYYFGTDVTDIDTPDHGLCLVGGRGAGDFINLLYQERQTGFFDSAPNQLHTAVSNALFLSSQLLAGELITGPNLSTFYGGGTEIATFSDGGYQKVGDILYSFWRYEGEGDDARLFFKPMIYKLDYLEDTLLIRRITLPKNSGSNNKLDKEDSLNFFIPSILRNSSNSHEIKFDQIPDLNAKFSVLFVLIPNETESFSVTIMVHHSPDREGPVRISVENEQMALRVRLEMN